MQSSLWKGLLSEKDTGNVLADKDEKRKELRSEEAQALQEERMRKAKEQMRGGKKGTSPYEALRKFIGQ
jgi:hypothetical protein